MSLIQEVNFPSLGDARGNLVALEANKDIPFEIQRVYYIFGNKEDIPRGFHAHKALKQVAICVSGSCKFFLDNGKEKAEIILNTPTKGILIENLVWREMRDFTADCVLLVLASAHYDETDYIRDYEQFLAEVYKPFIHPLSDVKSIKIGQKTRVWQYSVIFENAVIGENCNICAHTLIENHVKIGNNVTVKSGVFIWDGITVEDNVFIGPSVSFTNDKKPKSKYYPESFLQTIVQEGASIGANATILPGLVIGKGSMVGAGAVVTKDVPDYAIMVGNPASIKGYIK